MGTSLKSQTGKALRHVLVILLGSLAGVAAHGATPDVRNGDTVTVEAAPLLDADELKQLVGPVALYPDDLLAVVLAASTYPLQIVAAARFRADEANDDAEPDADWDESVVALLNYPEALALLNDDINWTWELGQAMLDQEQDLMQAVQVFRQEAYAAGNIDSDDKQTVYVKDRTVIIEPADPEVVYVPYYEPADVIVYQPRRVYHYYDYGYPSYYYPYSAHHYYYDRAFWGISSIFTLSWAHHNLHHYNHRHPYHRYAHRSYHRKHFRYTDNYRAPRAHHRRLAHRRAHDYAYNGHWRPRVGHHGARPYARDRHATLKREQRHARRADHNRRHIERKARHHYASLREDRRGLSDVRRLARDARRNAQTDRSVVHRDTRRERNAVRQSRERSSVHRPRVDNARVDNAARYNHADRLDRPDRPRRAQRRATDQAGQANVRANRIERSTRRSRDASERTARQTRQTRETRRAREQSAQVTRPAQRAARSGQQAGHRAAQGERTARQARRQQVQQNAARAPRAREQAANPARQTRQRATAQTRPARVNQARPQRQRQAQAPSKPPHRVASAGRQARAEHAAPRASNNSDRRGRGHSGPARQMR